jgi:hypothetical protein
MVSLLNDLHETTKRSSRDILHRVQWSLVLHYIMDGIDNDTNNAH